MKRLWAPWRIRYILDNKLSGKKKPGCFLCIKRTRGYKRRHLILRETDYSYVLLNKHPYASGHLMVIPKRHAADMDDLTDDEMSDFFSLLRFSCAALRSALEPDGLNVGANLGKAAGAGAEDHLHFHIVARWNGDHNFMPVIADTMVMPDYLTRIYETLLPSFSADRDS